MKKLLIAFGDWLIELGHAIRENAGAVAHARSHPTELQDR